VLIDVSVQYDEMHKETVHRNPLHSFDFVGGRSGPPAWPPKWADIKMGKWAKRSGKRYAQTELNVWNRVLELVR
jgi:hypothetical protein